MTTPLHLTTAFIFAALASCGNHFDADNDCYQSAVCCRDLGVVVLNGDVDRCVERSTERREAADPGVRASIDQTYSECSSKLSCGYVNCSVGAEVCTIFRPFAKP